MDKKEMSKNFYKLSITTPDIAYDAVAGILALQANFGWRENSLPTGETVFTIHCENSDFLDDLQRNLVSLHRDIIFERSEEIQEDWLHSWQDFFTPVLCGSRFVILPPWLADDNFGQRSKIIINPKSAFGTGHHATTSLCLTALSDLLDEGRVAAGQRFLDLGCGTGVLGIGACLSGLNGLGLDIDPLAVENAKENMDLNSVSGFTIGLGSIENAGDTGYDLIMANILSAPLIAMSAGIVTRLRPGGVLILSGILDIQAENVERAFCRCGLPPARKQSDGEWRTLLFA